MFQIMDIPAFLQFTPVPVRAQHNSWSPRLQRLFILALARGAGPGEAAARLGRTRQSVYRLRGKPGAESFAAAWETAQAVAGRVAAVAATPASGFGGIEAVLVPRYYRGRLIGFVQREDTVGAMRLLRQLDTLAERVEAGGLARGPARRPQK